MVLKGGRVYRAKVVKVAADGYLNDRQIIYMSALGDFIQYDSPTIKNGGKYKTVTKEDFIKWADRDVTDDLPKGEWQYGTQEVIEKEKALRKVKQQLKMVTHDTLY